MSDNAPDVRMEAKRNRAIGALVGLAVGDAVGTTLEFRARDTYEPLTDMIGGGPFALLPGEWTDDTSMALALADSLLATPNLDERDLMTRFVEWRDNGRYSCRGKCFDIGITTNKALQKWLATGNPIAGSTDPLSAGNGSLMRLAPVAVRHWANLKRLVEVAVRQSATTHAAPEALEACALFAQKLANAIAVESTIPFDEYMNQFECPNIRAIASGAWRGKSRGQIRGSGYVVQSLEAALWCVDRSSNFKEAILLAANLGEDADTTAAIAGQLAGAIWGYSGIPQEWLDRLAKHDEMRDISVKLFEASCDS